MVWKGALLLVACVCTMAAANGRAPCHRSFQDPQTKAADCARCHGDVHTEWLDSAHARAFTDPAFQQQVAACAEPERCMPCHVPASVLDRLGRMPQARTALRDEGITCIACHRSSQGMHGPSGIATAAHPTVKDATFRRRGSFGLCRSCHDMRIADVLPLAREFERGGLTLDDSSCVGCHMPATQRAGAGPFAAEPAVARRGRSHRLLGPSDAEFCSSAFLFRVERRGGKHVLVLTNGAGHGIPGLARLRKFVVRATLQAKDGRELATTELVLSSDDRLLVDEERCLPLPVATGAATVAVRVDHGYLGKTVATVLDKTLELP